MGSGADERNLGEAPKGMIGPVQRILLLSLLPLVAMGVVGSASSAAGETRSQPRPLCRALKPGVQASQRIPPSVRAASPQTFAKSKNEILAEISAVLKTLRSVKLQIRSAPADVRSSFDRALSVDENFQQAIQRATTKRQIMSASRTFGSSAAKVVTFDAYVLSQCEGSVPDP
jgi:hypothetical protein